MKLIKEIKAKDTGEVHFRRWAIFETKYLSVYYHEIFQADKDAHMHSHPWNIFTMILSGGYVEQTESGHVIRRKWHMANRWRGQFHKIKRMLTNKVTTLAVCYGKRGEWGYKIGPTAVISNDEYRRLKHAKPYEFNNLRK